MNKTRISRNKEHQDGNHYNGCRIPDISVSKFALINLTRECKWREDKNSNSERERTLKDQSLKLLIEKYLTNLLSLRTIHARSQVFGIPKEIYKV